MRLHASLVAITLIAFGLRVAPLTQNRFHPDEAWYAHFALRIASGGDPWLRNVVVDKPPLPFYLTAGSLSLLGTPPHTNPTGAEFALRLPSVAAGAIGVALLYRLGRRLYGARAGRMAALVLALSPLAILFSITLFTDTLLTAFLLWSLWAAARGQWGWSGVAFALAFASKQTALFFLPLVWAIGLVCTARRFTFHALARWLLPVAAGVALIFLWDTLRQPEIGFWAQGYADNNPHRFVRSGEFVIRFWELVRLAHYMTASTVVNLLLVAGCLGLVVSALTRRARTHRAVFDLILIAFALGYLAAYWLLAFNLWDRYLVALTPLLALLLARVVQSVISYQSVHRSLITDHWLLITVYSILIISLFIPALQAARSKYPVGGDHGAYDGIEQVAAYLYTVEEGAVLYDYWLSWEFSFYLYDGPLYLAWLPGPPALATDLQAHGDHGERYFVAPAWESFSEMEQAIQSAGFQATPLLTTHRRDGEESFTLYQIVPDLGS